VRPRAEPGARSAGRWRIEDRRLRGGSQAEPRSGWRKFLPSATASAPPRLNVLPAQVSRRLRVASCLLSLEPLRFVAGAHTPRTGTQPAPGW